MNEYDENGFDKDWVHIVTGTRYDEYGFNKNRSIHKDTRLPVDTNGYRRSHYPKSIFSLSEKVICFDETIKNLFFQNDDLYILKNLITASPLIDQKKGKDKKSIRFIDYKQTSNQVYTGPKCLDGSPDLRYNGGFTTKYNTTFTVGVEQKVIKETFNQNLSKKKIEKAIDQYNFYLLLIRDKQVVELYNILIDINCKCNENKKKSLQLIVDIKEKLAIYSKLEKHKDKFSEEQQEKFINLGQKIKDIEGQLKDINSFNEEFEKVYQKFLIRLNEIRDTSTENELDDLFSQIK